MTTIILPVSFFLGANNKNKYCSLFGEIYNPYEKGCNIILKGGPGTGKSTLMKKVAKKLDEKGYFIERGFCSADPSSLDAVTAPEIAFSIFDGTSPHVIEPTLPGVTEHIVDLGKAWDRKLLKEHINEIGELTKANKLQHKKVADFMRAAAHIETQGVLICSEFIDKEKVLRYAKRLCARYLVAKKGGQKGKLKKRFLSGITPEGVKVFHETPVALSEKIITIEDEYNAVSPFIVEYFCSEAIEKGYDVYACYCPLFPEYKLEHIIIPELKLCVFSENSYHYSIDDEGKRVHASRFFDMALYNKNKEKLKFLKKAKKELIDECVKKLILAKDIHDKLEEYYINATDFGVIDEIGERILSRV
ncbi:MAG: hypothetical protein IKT55_02335 [Clostridia bacterium]|nr:hypothetical protein [Clostridia bacterium]